MKGSAHIKITKNKHKGILILLMLPVLFINLSAQNNRVMMDIPLSDSSQLTIEGKHRFLKIAGITGLHVSSLKTKAFVQTTALDSEKGTVSFWITPLEDMNKSFKAIREKNSMSFALLADRFPPRETEKSNFSVYYKGSGYPRCIGRFTNGEYWPKMNSGMAPIVYAEELPLLKNQWYHITLTWDKPANTMFMYINGQVVGYNYSAIKFMETSGKIYLGNPLMVISNLKIQNKVLTENQIKAEYMALRPVGNSLSDETIRSIITPQDKPLLNIQPESSWEQIYACKFDRPSDLDAWAFQTGDLFYEQHKLRVTNEGLYWKTPDTIHNESRGYLWCPFKLEGDCRIEYEFQLLSPKGLSLLIAYASGIQGEDVIEDHGLENTGSMDQMLYHYRNYHWEYVRRVEAIRTDVETQYVNKNPWGESLYVGCVPRFETGRWYKIRFIKIGNRLHGSIDGKTVFDVTDEVNNNGPVFNSGRVVLRQMYHTAMRYRNFAIYRKK